MNQSILTPPNERWNAYTTEHPISRTIMPAFALGCNGQIVPPTTLLPGNVALYGILRGTENILKEALHVGRETIYLDHGYMSPSKHTKGDFGGYYRVVRNARQAPPTRDYPDDRFRKLSVDVRPWVRRGRNILVIPLTGAVADFYGIDPRRWLESVVREIHGHTDRPIVIKEKGEGDIQSSLKDTWCVVTHSSNVAVDALLAGVPVVTLGESAAAPMSWKWGHIENPHWPEREGWLHGLAYQQWTLEEMANGRQWDWIE